MSKNIETEDRVPGSCIGRESLLCRLIPCDSLSVILKLGFLYCISLSVRISSSSLSIWSTTFTVSDMIPTKTSTGQISIEIFSVLVPRGTSVRPGIRRRLHRTEIFN